MIRLNFIVQYFNVIKVYLFECSTLYPKDRIGLGNVKVKYKITKNKCLIKIVKKSLGIVCINIKLSDAFPTDQFELSSNSIVKLMSRALVFYFRFSRIIYRRKFSDSCNVCFSLQKTIIDLFAYGTL